MIIEFFVSGIPRGAGSKSAFALKQKMNRTCKKCGFTEQVLDYSGRVNVSDASGKPGKEWRALVTAAAFQAMKAAGAAPFDEPVSLRIEFVMPRPQSHFRSGRNAQMMREDAPDVHSIRPDTTKLIRAVEDSLTGIVWSDDARVFEQYASKSYEQVGKEPGAQVVIEGYSDRKRFQQAMRTEGEQFANELTLRPA